MRNKGLQVSPRVMATTTQNWRPTRSEPPAYNKTIMYDERPGGTKMPILKADGSVIRQKEWDENRHTFESTIRRNRTEGASSQGD
jgi:hypothetical protein